MAAIIWTVLAVSALVVALDNILPYSFSHRREIEVIRFKNTLKAFEGNPANQALDGGLLHSNSHSALFRYSTNIVVDGNRYQTVLGATNSVFRGKGMLVGGNGHVFWISRDGDVETLP